MSSEESNKMSKKTPSQDSNSEIEWDLEELLTELKVEVYADKDAYIDSDGEQWYSGDDDDGYAD